MLRVNEQLDDLWEGNLPEGTQESADRIKHGLTEWEKGNAVETSGVHLPDMKVAKAVISDV